MDLLPFGLFLINLYLEMNDKIEFSPFLTNLLFNFLEIVTFTMTTQISKKWLIIMKFSILKSLTCKATKHKYKKISIYFYITYKP